MRVAAAEPGSAPAGFEKALSPKMLPPEKKYIPDISPEKIYIPDIQVNLQLECRLAPG